MNGKIFVVVLAAVLIQVSGFVGTYRAAVVEYHPVVEKSDGDTVAANALNYAALMKEAKNKGAQIIVFPESGLATQTLSPIPDPADGIVPWSETIKFQTTQFVKNLSRASMENKIYSVVNLPEKRMCESDDTNCPPKGYYSFNTNVVFDRSGKVIARYAWYNLYDDSITPDRPKDAEISFFDTDFGVRFGMLTSYDIIFSAPTQNLLLQYGITDFVCPTLWFGELPFLTALQAQRGWSEANNVNLLAAGLNRPSRGLTGSGIYNGKYGRIVEVMLEADGGKLLTAEVPKIEKYRTVPQTTFGSTFSTSKFTATAGVELGLGLLKDDMNMYHSEVIEAGAFEKKICRNDFCCDFDVTMDSLRPQSKNYSIRAVVSNGVRTFGKNFRGGVQSCGIVACNGPHILNCTNRLENIPGLFRFKEITIKGRFNRRNSFQMPSTLTDGKELKPLSVNKYEFDRKETDSGTEVTLELLWPVTDLRTFGIWGRNFVRDMEDDYPVAEASAILSKPVIFGSFVSFLLFTR